MMRGRRSLLPRAAVAAGLALAGCGLPGEPAEPPRVTLPDGYRGPTETEMPPAARPAEPAPQAPAEAGREADRADEEDRAELPSDLSRWWTDFGNAELDSLVERALANNHRVKAAVSRIAQAEALLRATGADEWPEIEALAEGSVAAPREGIGDRPSGAPLRSERLYRLGLRADYEVDLWGKNAAATEAAYERARASVFAHRTVALTLVSDVVSTYLRYLSLQDRLRDARESERVMREMLEAIQGRLREGDGTRLQVAQQRAAVAESAAVVPVLALERDRARDALALFLGVAPADLDLKGTSLSEVSIPRVAPGLPARLLERRPDILQARAELAAAGAEIDSRRAALLPSISLTGEGGLGSRDLTSLLRPEALFYDLAAEIVQTLFDAGRREAEVAGARATFEERVHTYLQAAYRALREVEDALSGVHFLSLRLNALREAAEAAELAHEVSRESFEIGAVDYLTLLDTERTWKDTVQTLHEVELDRANASVALFKALGGGPGDFAIKAENGGE